MLFDPVLTIKDDNRKIDMKAIQEAMNEHSYDMKRQQEIAEILKGKGAILSKEKSEKC